MKPQKERELVIVRDRWFSEKLTVQFPSIGAEAVERQAATCDEFVRSFRLAAAFSVLSEAHEAAGMSHEEALAHDRKVNSDRFGVEDPRGLLLEVSRQFDCAPSGQVDADVLKKGLELLDAVRLSSLELAASCVPSIPFAAAEAGGDELDTSRLLQAEYVADAEALGQAQNMVRELLEKLGLPPS